MEIEVPRIFACCGRRPDETDGVAEFVTWWEGKQRLMHAFTSNANAQRFIANSSGSVFAMQIDFEQLKAVLTEYENPEHLPDGMIVDHLNQGPQRVNVIAAETIRETFWEDESGDSPTVEAEEMVV